MTTKRKAERILAKKQQHPLNEHELDLFLSTAHVHAKQLIAADAHARTLQVASLAAPDSLGLQQQSSSQPAPSSSPRATSTGDAITVTDGDNNGATNASVNAHQPITSQDNGALSQNNEFLPGMVLLRNFLTPSEQQQLVNDAQQLGLSTGGFYKPTYASGAKCRLHQMCLGKHWNVVKEQYEQTRSNFDNAQVPPLPDLWSQLAIKSLDAARAMDPRVMGDCKAMNPDICVVNYYKKAGRNGMHVDKDESEEAMAMGSPVISFSIGCAAEFAFIDHYPVGYEAVPVVRLETGDVLVFGGPSRKLVHALTRVYPNTQPSWLRMRSGRLNFTFREFKPSE